MTVASVLVIAKEPIPGRVKTRLTPAFTPTQAAALAAAAIQDTVTAAGEVHADRHVLVLDGNAGEWVPPGWDVVAQVSGDLDLRLAAAFAGVTGSGPAVLVGMDTPQVRAEQIASFRSEEFDACFGPAADGGFWAIGFTDPARAVDVIPGVPMSRADTGDRQLQRLHDAGLRVQILDELVDVDTAAEARTVAASAPRTRFATELDRIDRTAAGRTDRLASPASVDPSIPAATNYSVYASALTAGSVPSPDRS